VWDTAIVTICLRESGVPAEDPRMKQAAEWLMGKEIRRRGDWIHKNPAQVEPSGWVFEYKNEWNPDVDDTAMVLLALRLIATNDPAKRDECFARGLKWMMTFQCKDGGWAAFDKDCTKNILEKVPFADHNAMLDPECADITARILELLGYEGWDANHPQVKAALKYIRNEQEDDGSWYGRWGVNYIYGTWQVLRGMRALNLDMSQPWLQKARHCDYFASSLHKWLYAPIGSGMMYVRKNKIRNLYPLFAMGEPLKDDIRKFEALGTRPMFIEQAISKALDFHEMIGNERKEKRLHYLKNYWFDKVKNVSKVRLHTSFSPKWGCAIGNVSIEGKKPGELDSFLLDKYKVHTVGIEWENIKSVRVTPNVYTTTKNLDVLVEGINAFAKQV
jgi:hypothetical protein